MARQTDPQKRQAILQSARKIFARDGYGESKISNIATEAGVASGTVYLYFDSKEAIAEALAEDFMKRVSELIREHIPKFDTPAGIEAYIDAVVKIAREEKDSLLHVRTDLMKSKEKCSLADRHKLLKVMAACLESLMDQGKIRRYDPVALGDLIAGMMHKLVMSCVVFEDLPLEAHRKTAAELLIQALHTPDSINGHKKPE